MVKTLLKRGVPPAAFAGWHALSRVRLAWRVRSLLRANAGVAGVAGGTCHILGSGPSLNALDLSKLPGAGCITLNNLVSHPGFAALRPAYHLIAPLHRPQTDAEWIAWLRTLDAAIAPGTTLLCGLGTHRPDAAELIAQERLFVGRRVLHYAAHQRSFDDAPYARVDPAHVMDSGWAASVYAIAWAIHLGFKRIVLLGMDHNYFMFRKESEMRFYASAPHQNDELRRTFGGAFYVEEFGRIHRIFRDYAALRDLALSRGIEIVNGGDDTVLKVFPHEPHSP